MIDLQLIPDYDPYEQAEDCKFVEEKAKRAIDFIEELCTHTKGALAGSKLLLEPWQKCVIANMFGWIRPDGMRRYREVFFFVPRKNGKSLLSASIGNYMFFCDGEPGAEIYVAGAERDQASLCWNMSKQMILNEPYLDKRCKIYTASRSITNEKDGSFYRPISADAGTKHGFNAHCCLIDELHAHRNAELMDVLITSTGARKQPMIVYLTTSDYEREGSPCNERHDYAGKVRDNIIKDSRFLPVIYEATVDDDWTKQEVWEKANPNLGVSISLEFLERECKKAIESPAFQNTFKRLYLNIRTEQDVRWINMERWDASGDEMDIECLEGHRCYAGVDLASVSDLCALVLYFPEQKACLSYFWVPKDSAIKRSEKNRIGYMGWHDSGDLYLTDGNVADYDIIRAKLNELNMIYEIREVAIDRWNSTQMQTQLSGDGFEVVPFGQGFGSMSAPTKELEKMILSGELQHFGHPVLRWCASNVSVEIDHAENMKPSKKKSTEKIDGIVSLIMALGRAMVEDEEGSAYDDHEMIFI